MFKIFKPQSESKIEFLCYKEDWEVIPKPFPAKRLMPDWYKALPPKLDNKGLGSSTVKRCHPFLDALSIGWIIPLAADVEFITNEDSSHVQYKWNFYKPMIENHGFEQITSEKSPTPYGRKPPMKFINYWAIRVPEDYSVLFVPPLNRHENKFECFSGLVDCDGYFEFINFPFLFHEPNWSGILPAGTPLVQAIPIKRDSLIKDFDTKPLTQQDHNDLTLTKRRLASQESYYKDKVWTKK